MSVNRELNDIAALMSNCLDAYTAAVFVYDDRSKLLNLRAFHSLSKHIIADAQCSPEDGSLIGWVAKNNEPLTMDHFERVTKSLPYYQSEENIKSFLAVPLDRRRGVLCVDSKRQYVFTNKDQKLLSGFATVISNTLGAELEGHRHEIQRELLTFWRRADALPADTDDPVPYLTRLLDAACPYLKADAGVVAVPVKEGKFLQPVAASGTMPAALLKSSRPASEGIMGWIFQNRKTLVIPKFRSRTRIPFLFGPRDGIGTIGALIGMPLAWEADDVGGVIAFIRRTEANWSKEETSAITAIVRRATLVLQNFTLKRELALVSNLDPITEVCNTDAFNRVLNKRLQRCQEASVKLGLGIIAIEGFDALSTIVALPDLATLRQRIASTLLQRLKKRQLMGCLDPARFAVLFEDETETEINDQLTAITTVLHQQVLENLDELPRLEASFGFALYPRDAATSRELWTMAFQALTDRTYNSQRKVVPGR
ncbi:MAG: GAF domain-containing protein [Deltaproteobacteria bacterium]|nr:MAG: GAF domain-containing protein [Deltaproteobacteria bacterium]